MMNEVTSTLEDHSQPLNMLHHDDIYESENGQASVYLYKREGETAAEILQPLISQDPRHFRCVSQYQFIKFSKSITVRGGFE